MKTTVNKYDFRDAFHASQYSANFSYSGLAALFNYLEEQEEDTGEEMELDITAIACDWTEYSSINECLEDRGLELEEVGLDEEEAAAELIEGVELSDTNKAMFFNWLSDQTSYFMIDDTDSFIMMDF